MQPSNEVIQLYDGPAPGSESWSHQEQEHFSEQWQTQVVYNVSSPTLTVFRPGTTKWHRNCDLPGRRLSCVVDQ